MEGERERELEARGRLVGKRGKKALGQHVFMGSDGGREKERSLYSTDFQWQRGNKIQLTEGRKEGRLQLSKYQFSLS